jgi:hypothetical protein
MRRYFNKEYKLIIMKRNLEGQNSGKISKELGLVNFSLSLGKSQCHSGEKGFAAKRHPGLDIAANVYKV